MWTIVTLSILSKLQWTLPSIVSLWRNLWVNIKQCHTAYSSTYTDRPVGWFMKMIDNACARSTSLKPSSALHWFKMYRLMYRSDQTKIWDLSLAVNSLLDSLFVKRRCQSSYYLVLTMILTNWVELEFTRWRLKLVDSIILFFYLFLQNLIKSKGRMMVAPSSLPTNVKSVNLWYKQTLDRNVESNLFISMNQMALMI